MKYILLILVFLLTQQTVLFSQNIEDTLTIFGRDRFYRVHLPPGYTDQKDYAVVFVFHGGLGSPDNIENTTGFSTKADKEGFIAVYPYGTGAFDKKLLTWNTWDCCGYADKKDINDVEFIKLVLREVKEKYSINEKMIYAAGFSNGGMMCYLLACEMPGVFAAVAPVAATMFGTGDCRAESQVSMIIFNSVDDKHIPFDGGIGEESIVQVEKMAVEKVVEFWTEKFQLIYFSTSVAAFFSKVSFGNENGTELVFYRMLKGGHTWPGGERSRLAADKPLKEVSATDLIWDFFRSHTK